MGEVEDWWRPSRRGWNEYLVYLLKPVRGARFEEDSE